MESETHGLGLRLVFEYSSRYLISAFCAAIILAITAMATLVLLSTAGWFVSNLLSPSAGDIYAAAALYLGGVAAVAGLSALRFWLVTRFGELTTNAIRRDLSAAVLACDFQTFEEQKPGEFAGQISGDLAVLQSSLGSTVSVAARNVVMLAGGLGLLLWRYPLLVLVVVIVAGAAIAPLHIWGAKVRGAARDAQEILNQAIGRFTEAVMNIETVKVFGQQTAEHARFARLVSEAQQASFRQIRYRAIMNAMLIGLLFGGLGLVVLAASLQAQKGAMPQAEMASFVALAVGVATAAAALGDMYGNWQRTLGAADRVAALIYAPRARPAATSAAGDRHLGLKIEGLTFCYPSRRDELALSDVSIRVEPGERVAIVGPSGAGKSTLFKLMLGLYAPCRGVLAAIDERDRIVTCDDMIEHLAVVPQDVAIFADTVMANIRFAVPGAEDEAVVEAAVAAHADEFIRKLPSGYDTELGPRGIKLSGGQRQRVAIARAALRDAPILLLDEATSALDAESEALVLEALARLRHGRTSITIAHRLSTVIDSDRIYVLDAGRVVDAGSHQELMARCELYERLARSQLAAISDPKLVDESRPAPERAGGLAASVSV